MTTFQVAIHVGNTVGAIFYEDGKAEVRLDHIKKEAVEKFLQTPLTMDVAVNDIHTFETKTLQPLEPVPATPARKVVTIKVSSTPISFSPVCAYQ